MPKLNSNPEDLTAHLKTLSEMDKGDLFVKFDLHFPKNLTIEKRKAIVEILNKNREETDE